MKYKYLYVLLTKTPLKTGKLIRKFTKFDYNHCSISFDKNFKTLYSFSRKHKKATFYAGLVEESSLRYTSNKEETKAQIFKIPIDLKTYIKIKKYLKDLKTNEEEYIYNYLSILAYPFHKKVNVKNAYTCCEFTVHILRDFCKMMDIDKDEYCSIKDLSTYLEKYLIYEGLFEVNNNSWNNDKYLQDLNFLYKTYKIIELFTELLKRFLKGLITR